MSDNRQKLISGIMPLLERQTGLTEAEILENPYSLTRELYGTQLHAEAIIKDFLELLRRSVYFNGFWAPRNTAHLAAYHERKELITWLAENYKSYMTGRRGEPKKNLMLVLMAHEALEPLRSHEWLNDADGRDANLVQLRDLTHHETQLNYTYLYNALQLPLRALYILNHDLIQYTKTKLTYADAAHLRGECENIVRLLKWQGLDGKGMDPIRY
jgi:hypothetical protein